MISNGIAVSALAMLVGLIEVAEWLITGHWPGWSIEDGLLFFGVEEPLLRFDFAQLALDVLVDLPLAVAVYLLGLGIYLFAVEVVDPI